MDKAKASRLSALIWRDRLRVALPIIAVIALLAGIAAFLFLDEKYSERTVVYGQVDSWSRKQSEDGSSTYVIWVTLPDGSKVVATAARAGRAPTTGERIELLQIRTAIGRVSYEWAR